MYITRAVVPKILDIFYLHFVKIAYVTNFCVKLPKSNYF